MERDLIQLADDAKSVETILNERLAVLCAGRERKLAVRLAAHPIYRTLSVTVLEDGEERALNSLSSSARMILEHATHDLANFVAGEQEGAKEGAKEGEAEDLEIEDSAPAEELGAAVAAPTPGY